jgi:hypothetical protein
MAKEIFARLRWQETKKRKMWAKKKKQNEIEEDEEEQADEEEAEEAFMPKQKYKDYEEDNYHPSEERGELVRVRKSQREREPAPTSKQLSKEEIGDMLEGHLVRASQLLQIFRSMKE